jgi:acetolactate decarboxylase
MPIDTALAGALHVEYLKKQDLGDSELLHHTLFQTSTIDTLLEGNYDGDVTFAELGDRGDFGLGTLNALDGEMIALDGRFLRADADGAITDVAPGARTPFALMTWFAPTVEVDIEGPRDFEAFVTELNRHAPPGSPVCAVRADGEWELVHARSVPRQHPPYPSLAEVAHEQHMFDLHEVEGTMVGFRFPQYAQGLELAGYHLHFVDAARRRGGHVLSCRPRHVRVAIDHARDLHVELPPGVELGRPDTGIEARARIRDVEGG